MKKLILATTLVGVGFVGLNNTSWGHGGTYRGPGDTVPPGGGPGGSGPAGPAPPPGAPGTAGGNGPTSGGPGGALRPIGPDASNPVTGGLSPVGADLTLWEFWWGFNKEPYLNLKAHVHSTGSTSGLEGFDFGRGQKRNTKKSLRPTKRQIREEVVPALRRALESETNNDIVSGALIALAKIGDAKSESGASELEAVIAPFLADSNQEISETAAVALGILAHDSSIELLEHLLGDTQHGRAAVQASEVNYRTRSFAAYGLGLIGARTGSADHRTRIVGILADAIRTDDTRSRDLRVACIVALGLVRLDEQRVAAEDVEVGTDPSASLVDQIAFLFNFFRDESRNHLVRAHCPAAMARLLGGLSGDAYDEWRETIAEDLLARIGKRGRDKNEVIGSSVLALGLIGTSASGELDERIRTALSEVPKNVSDHQARYFSLIAMAKVGAVPAVDSDAGVRQAAEYLLSSLSRGSSGMKPWAGLGIGVLSHRMRRDGRSHAMLTSLSEALREALQTERDNSKLGAFAIATGIMGDVESYDLLIERFDRTQDDQARGYVAVALGLLGERGAVAPIQRVVEQAKYRPQLLEQAAIALGLLGDEDLVDVLVAKLGEANGLASQAAIASALGFIGDRNSINPLLKMLADEDDRLTDRARGFAAVALGIVADKEPLPWNSKIAVDLNYRASTPTLVDASGGTGILDIL